DGGGAEAGREQDADQGRTVYAASGRPEEGLVMAVELASAYISLVPSLRGAEKAIEKQLGGAADKTSKSFAGRFSSGATKWMRRGGLAIAGAATAAMGLALKKGFDRLTGIENAQAKLSGLGHSAQGVKRIVDDALASVKGTAFGLDEAASVAASAVASGVKPGKDLERTLKLVADAATISGSSMGDMGLIFNKVAASNKVQGEVIAQLSERGIPIIQLLSKELGTSAAETVKLASQGKINFDTFRKAMEAGMGGAALKSGSTFKGALANVQAALGRLGASVLTGVFPQIRDGMNGLIPILDSLGPAATKAGEVLGAAFARTAAVVKSLGSAIGAVGTILFKGDFNKAVGEALQVEEDSPLVDVLFRVRETAQKAGKALGVAREAVALFIGSFTGLGADVGKYLPADLWNPIIDGGAKARQVFDQLAPAVRNVVSLVGTYLAEQGKNWQSIISGVLPMVVPIVTQVIGFVGEMAKKITPRVGQVLSTGGAVFHRVMPGVQQVLGAVMGALRAIFPIVMQVVGTLLDALNDNWPTIRGIFTAIGDIVGEVFGLVAYVI